MNILKNIYYTYLFIYINTFIYIMCLFMQIYSYKCTYLYTYIYLLGFPGGSVVKNPPANSGDAGSISGLRRSPGDRNGNHSSILACKIPWTEEPGKLQSMESQRVGYHLATKQQHLYVTFFFLSLFGPWQKHVHRQTACCVIQAGKWLAGSGQSYFFLNSFPYAEKFTNLPMADVLGVWH